jgi:hypothetical protein
MPTDEPAAADDTISTAESGDTKLAADQPRPHQSPTGRAASRLTLALVIKSVAEAAFVVALLAQFAYTHFRPRVRGAVETADARTVAGWAVDASAPGARIELQLFIDGRFVARRLADRPPEAAAPVREPGARGFAFETPPLPPRETEYEARVFALHPGDDRGRATLRQIGNPARFRVPASEHGAGAAEK